MGRERSIAQEPQFLERIEVAPQSLAREAVSVTAPRSLAADRYRLLHFRLERICAERSARTIAVASALPGEGRTTTAVNLALTAARAGDRRVALIEADLERPALERIFGLEAGPGLVDLLEGGAQLENCLRQIARPALSLLPAGRRPGDDAEARLDGRRLHALLDLLKHRFDEIYVDMPPLLRSAEASMVAAAVDGVLLVVRPRTSSFESLQLAAEALGGAKVFGCALNDSGDLLGGGATGEMQRQLSR